MGESELYCYEVHTRYCYVVADTEVLGATIHILTLSGAYF